MLSESDDHRLLFDLLRRMLAYDVRDRLTLGEALRHPYFQKLFPNSRYDFGTQFCNYHGNSLSRWAPSVDADTHRCT